MKLLTKLKLMSKAKRLKDELAELITDEELIERDVSEDKMALAVQLYDKIVAIESQLPEAKVYREDAEIKLEQAFRAIEWYLEGRNPHLDEPAGDWS